MERELRREVRTGCSICSHFARALSAPLTIHANDARPELYAGQMVNYQASGAQRANVSCSRRVSKVDAEVAALWAGRMRGMQTTACCSTEKYYDVPHVAWSMFGPSV